MLAGIDVRIAGDDSVFPCSLGQSILDALAPVHFSRINSGCHGGGCGVCKIKVLSGRYSIQSMSRAHVSAAEEADGIVLSCRAWAETSVVIDVIGKLPMRWARAQTHTTKTKMGDVQ